jgi:ribonuclease P protein component
MDAPYTARSTGVSRFPIERGIVTDGERQTDVPAEQPAPREGARFPAPDADQSRSLDPGGSTPQRARTGHRLTCANEVAVRSLDVRRVFDEGRPVHGGRVVVFLAPGTGAAAFVAGRKVGNAVMRNRARRVLRAAWLEVAPRIGNGHDAVLVAREAIRGAKTQDLVAEMSQLLRSEITHP